MVDQRWPAADGGPGKPHTVVAARKANLLLHGASIPGRAPGRSGAQACGDFPYSAGRWDGCCGTKRAFMTRGDSGTDARFAALSDTVRALANRGVLRRYRKGTVLIEEGDRGDSLYVVVSGRVRVYSGNEADREVSFGVYGAGEYVGEMSLDGGPRSASVITIEPTMCAVVTRETLRAYISEHPDFAFELIAR